jgi:hypothetical protein
VRKRAVIVSATVIIITIVGIVVWPGKNEPQYKGKRLSEWAALQRDQPAEATNAVLAIGTNGLDTIIGWINYDIPSWRKLILKVALKIPQRSVWRGRIHKWIGEQGLNGRVQNAGFCFRVLGEQGRPAIPVLKRLISDGRSIRPNCAADALACMESDGLLALVDVLHDRSLGCPGRLAAAGALRFVTYRGPELKKAVPVLVSRLRDTNIWVQCFAAQVLGNFGCGHQQAVPALVQLTHSPDPNCRIFAARALGQFGAEARPALGTVSNLLSDLDVRVSRQAAQSVEKIRRSHD